MSHIIVDIPQKALIIHNGKILIAYDAVEKNWELPGGRIELGEENDLAGALRREIREELGVDVKVGEIFDAFVFTRKNSHCVLIYRCSLVGEPSKIKVDGTEVGEVRWISSMDEVRALEMEDGYKMVIAKFFGKN